MTATAEGSPPTSASRGRRAAKEKSSFWTLELGRKAEADTGEHPEFTPRLPRVNLLPDSVRESFLLRRVRRVVIAVGVLMLLGVAAVWYLQTSRTAEAQAALDAARADNAAIQAKVEALGPVTLMYQQITGEQELVRSTLASAPQAALVITHLLDAGAKASPVGRAVDFTGIQVSYRDVPQPGGEVNPCPNPDPFAGEITIGCITFNGTAGTVDQVSRLLTAIEADSFFVGPYVNNSTVVPPSDTDPGGVNFTGTVGVSVEALVEPLTQARIDAVLSPPPSDPATADGGQ